MAQSAVKESELVSEIAAASKEQAQGIEQINQAVAEMDKVIQQNAANAEENASAAEEMSAQSEQMKAFVGELVTMVGGMATGPANGNSSAIRQTKAKFRHALAGPSNFVKEEAATSPRSKELQPKHLIPLDAEDFKDF
jgi:methyl-accepting chemotaxis protein